MVIIEIPFYLQITKNQQLTQQTYSILLTFYIFFAYSNLKFCICSEQRSHSILQLYLKSKSSTKQMATCLARLINLII